MAKTIHIEGTAAQIEGFIGELKEDGIVTIDDMTISLREQDEEDWDGELAYYEVQE